MMEGFEWPGLFFFTSVTISDAVSFEVILWHNPVFCFLKPVVWVLNVYGHAIAVHKGLVTHNPVVDEQV